MTTRSAQAHGLSRASRLGRVAPLAFIVAVAAPSLPAHADPNALWRIVHDGCVPHFEAGQGPTPCVAVDLNGSVAEGVAILKDLHRRRADAGDPDPEDHRHRGSADARARRAARVRRRVEGEGDCRGSARRPGVAARSGRAGDQFAIRPHAATVARPCRLRSRRRRQGAEGLRSGAGRPMARHDGPAERPRPTSPGGSLSDDLFHEEPLLRLVADGVPDAKAHMGAMTFAAVGANFDGRPADSSCSPTSFRWKAEATPRTSRTTIAPSPDLRHDCAGPLMRARRAIGNPFSA